MKNKNEKEQLPSTPDSLEIKRVQDEALTESANASKGSQSEIALRVMPTSNFDPTQYDNDNFPSD